MKRKLFRILCLIAFSLSFFFFCLEIGLVIKDHKFYLIYSIAFLASSFLTWILYLCINSTHDEFERNHKKYVQKCFKFMLDKGYKLNEFSCNGEEAFTIKKDDNGIVLYIEDKNVDLTIITKDNLEVNIRTIITSGQLSFLDDPISIMQKVQELAKLVDSNFEKLEFNSKGKIMRFVLPTE